ncbi:uncharacterized protein LOC107646478 [Arachis ipaensis]|uniref:uncharacterized protein LOC107646478 n=1 Tax=Arachis ipaensis TaxID=130454 RepID=UPI0007AF4226|nr:uncharacterized protein LOC107646478 [Arachis ipaensis]
MRALVRVSNNYLCSSFSQIHKSQYRSIFSTPQLQASWMDKVKNVFTGQNPKQNDSSAESFTLLRFADEMKNARRIGTFKQFVVGRSSEVTFTTAFEKYEAILRCLANFDPTGENLTRDQKQEAAKHCNSTLVEVENTLAKFTWAKLAQKKIEKLKEEGKPLPTTISEVQKLVGSTPLDLARSNMAQGGHVFSRASVLLVLAKLDFSLNLCCGKTSRKSGVVN